MTTPLAANAPSPAVVREALANAPDFLASIGVSAEDFENVGPRRVIETDEQIAAMRATRVKLVGRGYYANVFSLPNGKVLKVTVDDDDAQAAELIRRAGAERRQPLGLPRVEVVRRLPGLINFDGKQQYLYAIVLEPVDVFHYGGDENIRGLKSWLTRMANRGVWTIDEAWEEAEGSAFPGGEPPPIFTDPIFVEKFDEAMQGVRWLEEHGFRVRDLHAMNFGETRDGRAVLFDFGDDSRMRARRVPIMMAKNPKIVGLGPGGAVEAAAGLTANRGPVSKAEAAEVWEALGSPDVDMDELLVGIEVEQEHTGDLYEAGKIAMDHLREFPDYYARLTKMETRAKAGLAPNPRVHVESREAAFKRLGAENNRFAAALRRIDSKYGLSNVLDEYARAKSAEEFMAVQRSHTARVAKVSAEDAARREQIMRQWEDVLSEKIGLMGRDCADIEENPGDLDTGEPIGLGDTVFHGTSTDDDEMCPCFDHGSERMWVSDSTDGSDFYSLGGGGSIPWRLTLEVYARVPPNLVMLRNFSDLRLLAARLGSPAVTDPRELAPLVCAAGYDGWHIENGEGGGSDTMLCEPARFLRLVKTERLDQLKSESAWGLMDENPSGSSMPKVRASFERHFDEAERVFPDLGTIELHVDEAAGGDNGHGSERQFGYCKDQKPIIIAFAQKTEGMPKAYVDGLMAHEFGHAIDFRYGAEKLERKFGKKLPESGERRADKIAEYTFGRRIEYGDLDIQCIDCGGKPTRPRRLG